MLPLPSKRKGGGPEQFQTCQLDVYTGKQIVKESICELNYNTYQEPPLVYLKSRQTLPFSFLNIYQLNKLEKCHG